MPHRFQIKRTKGWKMPQNGIIVSRPSKWGNPFKIEGEATRERSVELFDNYLKGMPSQKREELLAPLRGKDLGCWCSLDVPCHADILLKWVEQPTAFIFSACTTG
jgi:hypothetical protein